MSAIDTLIGIWSMRPSPLSDAGKAWEDGARQGWKWAIERCAKIADEADRERFALGTYQGVEIADAIRNLKSE